MWGGEGGALLSGGERQRVSLARALLKDAPAVLLGELTSALAPENEAAAHEGVERLVAGRTAVMVTHRMWTGWSRTGCGPSDAPITSSPGRRPDRGTRPHDELLRHGRRHAAFWNPCR
ncbi:hypothetical protein AB0F64_40010 [Streptomyces sp. NPDC026294]